MENKLEHLKEYLKGLGSVAVAFSSGVDSTFLLKVAHDVLGDKAIAITAQSCSFPKRELNEAKAFCEKEGIQHVICQSEELEIEGFSKNPPNRCYLCKKELFEKIGDIAKKNGIEYIAEGSNMDDNGDYRPGLIAVKELGVKSPLREAKLTKAEIREYSKELGLPTWDKQSFACLSSRFVYGETISEESLEWLRKQSSFYLTMDSIRYVSVFTVHLQELRSCRRNFRNFWKKNVREDIAKKFKEYGFTYVTMDILGYRMGSMNETLGENDKTTADSSLRGKNE